MGLIFDSSVLIAAERGGQTLAQFLRQVITVTGDQETALSAVALVELAHGVYRANTPAIRSRREAFIQDLLADVPVYPLTESIPLLAGRIDAEQQSKGVKIPFQDLLIGVTGLHLGYKVVTGNPRHFRTIPNLVVQQL
ncbi:MAG: PIN domain-containing protein [Bryobacteraceae bacterium]